MANATSTDKSGDEQSTADKPPRSPGRKTHSKLTTDAGNTTIADGVVSKIAGLAASEIPGVHSMGTSLSRRMGQLKSLVPGSGGSPSQGVAVEVGERETAIDLDVVTWYGQSIVNVTEAVRDNVIQRVQDMTGLKVVEVNINVDNVFVEGEDSPEPKEPRVQ
ncbi:MAG: Asp23/Gls24 family envelope stress response protein [Stackebrandtia sp.]